MSRSAHHLCLVALTPPSSPNHAIPLFMDASLAQNISLRTSPPLRPTHSTVSTAPHEPAANAQLPNLGPAVSTAIEGNGCQGFLPDNALGLYLEGKALKSTRLTRSEVLGVPSLDAPVPIATTEDTFPVQGQAGSIGKGDVPCIEGESADSRVRCLCGSASKTKDAILICSLCQCWFHESCLPRDTVEAPGEFVCEGCSPSPTEEACAGVASAEEPVSAEELGAWNEQDAEGSDDEEYVEGERVIHPAFSNLDNTRDIPAEESASSPLSSVSSTSSRSDHSTVTLATKLDSGTPFSTSLPTLHGNSGKKGGITFREAGCVSSRKRKLRAFMRDEEEEEDGQSDHVASDDELDLDFDGGDGVERAKRPRKNTSVKKPSKDGSMAKPPSSKAMNASRAALSSNSWSSSSSTVFGSSDASSPALLAAAQPHAASMAAAADGSRSFPSGPAVHEYAKVLFQQSSGASGGTLELKNTANTVTLTCRNGRKALALCPWMVKGWLQPQTGEAAIWKLKKVVLAHNERCLHLCAVNAGKHKKKLERDVARSRVTESQGRSTADAESATDEVSSHSDTSSLSAEELETVNTLIDCLPIAAC